MTLTDIVEFIKENWQFFIEFVVVGCILGSIWGYVKMRKDKIEKYPRYMIDYVIAPKGGIVFVDWNLNPYTISKPEKTKPYAVILKPKNENRSIPLSLIAWTPKHPEPFNLNVNWTKIRQSDKGDLYIEIESTLNSKAKWDIVEEVIEGVDEIIWEFRYRDNGNIFATRKYFVKQKDDTYLSQNPTEYFREGSSAHIFIIGDWFLKSNRIIRRWKECQTLPTSI